MNRRLTKQRKAIYDVMQGKNKHFSADEVLQKVQTIEPGMGLATVYRNLNYLCDAKMIQRVVDKGICFYDGNPAPHYHFRCTSCGKYEDIDMPYDESIHKMVRNKGLKITGHTITFEGLCKECNHLNKN